MDAILQMQKVDSGVRIRGEPQGSCLWGAWSLMELLWLSSGVSVRENPAAWVLGSGGCGGAHPGRRPQWGEKEAEAGAGTDGSSIF